MSARDTVLARVRRALGEPPSDAKTIEAEAAALVPHLNEVRPRLDDSDAVERFIEKATSDRVTATVERLPSPDALPTAVHQYLDRGDLGPRVAAALPPILRDLHWDALELKDEIDRNEAVALSYAEAAIAETGTLVFPSSPTVPTLFSFLALHHLAVVRADDILPHKEDAYQRFVGRALPRSLVLVTGTSGTADIEGQNIRGAHGPRYLHILILDAS